MAQTSSNITQDTNTGTKSASVSIAIPLSMYDRMRENTFGMIAEQVVENCLAVFMDTIQIAAQSNPTITLKLHYHAPGAQFYTGGYVIEVYGTEGSKLNEAFSLMCKHKPELLGQVQVYDFKACKLANTPYDSSCKTFANIFSKTNADCICSIFYGESTPITYDIPLKAFHPECFFDIPFLWSKNNKFDKEVRDWMKSNGASKDIRISDYDYSVDLPIEILANQHPPQVLVPPPSVPRVKDHSKVASSNDEVEQKDTNSKKKRKRPTKDDTEARKRAQKKSKHTTTVLPADEGTEAIEVQVAEAEEEEEEEVHEKKTNNYSQAVTKRIAVRKAAYYARMYPNATKNAKDKPSLKRDFISQFFQLVDKPGFGFYRDALHLFAAIMKTKQIKLQTDSNYTKEIWEKEADGLWVDFWNSTLVYQLLPQPLKQLLQFQQNNMDTKATPDVLSIRDDRLNSAGVMTDTLWCIASYLLNVPSQVQDFKTAWYCCMNCYNGNCSMHLNSYSSGPTAVGKSTLSDKIKSVLIPATFVAHTMMNSSKSKTVANPISYAPMFFSEAPSIFYMDPNKLGSKELEQYEAFKEIATSNMVSYEYFGFADPLSSAPSNRVQHLIQLILHLVYIVQANPPMTTKSQAMADRFFKNYTPAREGQMSARKLMTAAAIDKMAPTVKKSKMYEQAILFLRIIQLVVAKYHMFMNVNLSSVGINLVVPHIIINVVLDELETKGKKSNTRDAERVILMAQEICLCRVAAELIAFSTSKYKDTPLKHFINDPKFMREIEKRAVVSVEDTVEALHSMSVQWYPAMEKWTVDAIKEMLHVNQVVDNNVIVLNANSISAYADYIRNHSKVASLMMGSYQNKEYTDPNYITINYSLDTLCKTIVQGLKEKPQAAEVRVFLDKWKESTYVPSVMFELVEVSDALTFVVKNIGNDEKHRPIPILKFDPVLKKHSISLDFLFHYQGVNVLYDALKRKLAYAGMKKRRILLVDTQDNTKQQLFHIDPNPQVESLQFENPLQECDAATKWIGQMASTTSDDTDSLQNSGNNCCRMLRSKRVTITKDLHHVALGMHWSLLAIPQTEQKELAKEVAGFMRASITSSSVPTTPFAGYTAPSTPGGFAPATTTTTTPRVPSRPQSSTNSTQRNSATKKGNNKRTESD